MPCQIFFLYASYGPSIIDYNFMMPIILGGRIDTRQASNLVLELTISFVDIASEQL